MKYDILSPVAVKIASELKVRDGTNTVEGDPPLAGAKHC